MNDETSKHAPVLVDEVLQWLDPRPGKTIVDGTVGGGGHARRLAEIVRPDGLLVGLDRDPGALERAGRDLVGMPVVLVHTNYCDLSEVLPIVGVDRVDGVLLDLGMSSDQLADEDRGFSFAAAGPLDLRFDPEEGEPAWQLLARLDARRLEDLFRRYGEERFSRRIAKRIVESRKKQPIKTASDLADLIRRSIPRGRAPSRIHPATRVFQALRIAVNDEIDSLKTGLERIPDCMNPGARLAVISFHSLEDRCVKVAFRRDRRLHALTQKPLRPTEHEIAANPRARSAKLRVASRTDDRQSPP